MRCATLLRRKRRIKRLVAAQALLAGIAGLWHVEIAIVVTPVRWTVLQACARAIVVAAAVIGTDDDLTVESGSVGWLIYWPNLRRWDHWRDLRHSWRQDRCHHGERELQSFHLSVHPKT